MIQQLFIFIFKLALFNFMFKMKKNGHQEDHQRDEIATIQNWQQMAKKQKQMERSKEGLSSVWKKKFSIQLLLFEWFDSVLQPVQKQINIF